ncbi:MAG: hypothetical protein HDT28_08745 [Clostridiales bacterium]|nr:hypothetical protein [Clostridiales bacterium]
MDITSSNSLWKDYDVAALPLNESALSGKIENGITVREYYFDGYTTVDGRVRAFIKIYENAGDKGTILYMGGTNGEYGSEFISSFCERGYTVAVLDYLGKTESLAHYTLYPKSLEHCNSRGAEKFEITDDALHSRWYIWTCLARRAAYLLKTKYGGKLFAVGEGLGGTSVYKLAAFDDGISACATLLNIIPAVSGEGNGMINYHASLENYAYASVCKVPMYMAVASNAEDGSLDDMSELAGDTASLKCFRVIERAFSCGIGAVFGELDSFFTTQYDRPIIKPVIKASNSEGNLYFNITLGKDEADENHYDLDLYVAFCIDIPQYRNWMKLKTIGLGDTFMANINVCQADKPIYAFANVKTGDGMIISTPILSVLPKSLGIAGRAGVSHRRIYEGSMGMDGWIARRNGKLALVKGPYDIDGITSDNGSLITFKPGDPLFRVPADTLLQLMLSGKPQTITVTVSDKQNSYSCQVEITNTEDWHNFSLSHMNFKSANGPLFDWSQILILELTSDENFVIGSVLWV